MSDYKQIVKPEDKIVVNVGKMFMGDIVDELCKGLSADISYGVWSIMVDKYAGNYADTVKTMARCAPDDTWDEEFGKKLAEQRYYLKKHEKIAKYAHKMRERFLALADRMGEVEVEHGVKVNRIKADIDNYFHGKGEKHEN